MTVRAVILGLLGAALIAIVGYLNDSVVRLTPFVGNHLPISVFGILILLVMLANPALFRLRRTWRLRPPELAVAVTLMLVACFVPGSGLLRTFTQSLALPMQYNRQFAGWRQYDLLGYVPPALMPGDGPYDEGVMEGFLSGAHGKDIGLGDVPWQPWRQCLTTWMALIVLISVAIICLSLIVHRQWASRERLRYPIADFATSLLQQDEDRPVGTIFRNRLFWIGFAVVFVLHLINGYQKWNPDSIQIPLQFDFYDAVRQKWPKIIKGQGSWAVFKPRFYPTVVAFGFFLASDVGLSLGICEIAFCLITAWLINAGVDISYDYMSGGVQAWQKFGSYFGIALLLLYTGRRYYWQVLKRTFASGRDEEVEGYAVWASRVLILATVAAVTLLVGLGLDWPFAVLLVLLVILMFLVIARINAESGLFFCQPYWQPMAVFLGLFGAGAMGPGALVILGLLCAVLTIDPRECLMPFVVNGLKICDNAAVRPGRVGWLAVASVLLALAVAVPVVFWANYNYTSPQNDAWAHKSVPKFTFDTAERQMTKLALAEQLDAAKALTPFQRLLGLRPHPRFLWAAGIGLGLVLIFSVLRLRYTWWPLHPILFLVWGTHPLRNLAPSFLLGWIIKAFVTKLGGGRKYRQVTALMVGIIAGDLLGGLVFMAVGGIYYGLEGVAPKAEYRIFPP